MENVMSAVVALAANTTAERVGVVLFGAGVLVLTLVLARRFYAPSFFHGFLAAVGIFLSFDIVVFHWLFGLHRITEGSEADVIEPVLVALGVGFVAYALMAERRPERRT
jgi:hypothetical protein